jgi:hypothetical protein
MAVRRRSGWKVTSLAAIAVIAMTTGCGSSGSKNTASSAASVHVTAPADGSVVSADRVTVRGTVTPPDAAVQVVGQSAQVGNGVFTTSVALHTGDNSIDVVASAPGSAPATTSITITRRAGTATHRRRRAVRTQQGSAAPTPPLAGPSNCGGGLTAGAHTSCPFAERVRAAYNQTGSGVLDVTSPVTGQTYRMYCTAGAAHICTGGNNASVYFGDTSGYNTGNCGGGLSVGPNTSCRFADNVRSAYERSGNSVISAFSPATGRTYTMYCTNTSPHVCTGGNNAAVYFP